MGALSTYFNYNCYPYQPTQTTNNNSEITTFQHHEQEQNHYFNEASLLDESFIFQTYPCQDQQLLVDSTFSSQNDDFVSMNEIFPNEEDFIFNNYQLPCPKRQKLIYYEEEKREEPQQELLNSTNFFMDEFVTNPNPNPFASFEAEVEPPFAATSKIEKKVTERTISSQSIAARERRRKITEKTQELGKLVPGGPKMNTAEMLNAAANYVKFLQAQVGMLQLMETFSKEEKEPPPSEELHKLVVSPFVQEKLYSEEKCFVPKEFVTTLSNHDDVQSKPTILKGLKQLVGTEIEKKSDQE
ncbi:transcription factor bHLH52 [Medicago truncatula]|uniref:Transcription factor n=2 Tax=Medicago truncatula TaxID=3880 RepID=G8A0A1_MEDTR|nr:transcription factor bHLH52 [Medicago truncatula]KEH38270.1 transcription factor [Medicago truncatula]